MKKIILVTIALVFISSLSFADAFAPSVLKIVAEDEILYDFDGSGVEIGFTLEQKPANMYLVITTKGKAADIVDVQNGYLGCHYVNKFDTTVFCYVRYTKATGSNSILWDGKNQDGEDVEADEYYYYLWATDNISSRELACSFIGASSGWDGTAAHFIDYGPDNMPLAQPFLFNAWIWWMWNYAFNNIEFHPNIEDHQVGTVMKWDLGGDPLDVTLLETTYVAGYHDMWAEFMNLAGRDPNDESVFYWSVDDIVNQVTTLQKFDWVEGGNAVMHEDWGGWDNFTWDNPVLTSMWSINTPVYSDNYYIYMPITGGVSDREYTPMVCISWDGEEIFYKTGGFPGQWNPDHVDPETGEAAPQNFAPRFMDWSNNVAHKWVNSTGCMHQAVNYSRLHDDMDDMVDFLIYRNANGDYYLDTNSTIESGDPWSCGGATEINGVGIYGIFTHSLDKYDFSWKALSMEGNVGDIALLTPDGTGTHDIMSYPDRLSAMMVQHGTKYIACGSPYDGVYSEGIPPVDTASADKFSISMYQGADTFRGVITNESGTAVEEDGAAAFAVAQNAPNPFNPTTTINITIPEAGQVSIDVFNVAGQKVGTLVNDAMSAGTHSVVWDASGFSAGVYFYTVKSGDFSKTMKMTLLK